MLINQRFFWTLHQRIDKVTYMHIKRYSVSLDNQIGYLHKATQID